MGAVKNRWLSGLLLAFCCWHAVFLVISIIPAPPAKDDPPNLALDTYRLLFAGRQQLKMFETIPVQRSLSVRFQREDKTGNLVTSGCVLPGFKPYPEPENIRYYVLFYRMAFSADMAAYRDAYFQKAEPLLAVQYGEGAEEGERWKFVIEAEYTRHLTQIKRSGLLSMPFSKAFDLTVADGEHP